MGELDVDCFGMRWAGRAVVEVWEWCECDIWFDVEGEKIFCVIGIYWSGSGAGSFGDWGFGSDSGGSFKFRSRSHKEVIKLHLCLLGS